MRVALVHDHLAQNGGAELVLRVLHELWPDAPIFVLVYDPKRAHPVFRQADVRTSFIQRLPGGRRWYQPLFPLMPVAIESYDLMEYDLVISSSASFAKGVITRADALHLCYCHTPTRYLWSYAHRYVEEFPTNRVFKMLLPPFLSYLRRWDRLAADRVDAYAANSNVVRQRIRKYYRRDATVVYPPVETERFRISPTVGNYYLIGGRLVAYKRYDLAIRAFNKLGVPLKIFGVGPEYKFLKNLAQPNIEFVGKISEAEQAQLYAHAIGFLQPQDEDFGITAVESMASGRPVIAYNVGGALETVRDGVTGAFFSEETWESLADAVIRFRPERYSPTVIREHARGFDTEVFKQRFRGYVHDQWEQFRQQSPRL